MHVIRSDAVYEDMVCDYQIAEIHRLNQILKRHGISSTEQRRKICEEHAEQFSIFLDQGWIRGEQAKAYPMVVFAKRRAWTDEKVGEIQEVVLPKEASRMYEGYSQSIEWYFDERNEQLAPDIEVGVE